MLHAPDQIGPYLLGDLLGSGGMGDVFRGFHERLKRPVALKRIHGSSDGSVARRRLLFEAQTAARLNHPSIVQVYDILEHEGDDWIVMELVEGESLREKLSRRGLPWRQAVSIAKAIAGGLAAAHSIGILHRDLKVENVLLIEGGGAKLLDFGLAKDFQHVGTDSKPSLSAVGQILGTPRSMSPEQAKGEALGPGSDLFSFGVLLYECLTGASPFRADTLLGTLQRVCNYPHQPVHHRSPSVPIRLSRLVDHLLQKDPELRPENAHHVVEELERIADIKTAEGSDEVGAVAYSWPEQVTPSLGSSPTRPPIEDEDTSMLAGMGLRERRQITLLCSEIRGLALEDAYELLPKLRRRLVTLCKRYEGALVRASGRCLVVAFGGAVAHEDDALRAVQVGFSWLRELSDSDRAMSVCVAVHAGPAIARAHQLPGESLELGELVDEAIVMVRQSEHGQLVVSDVVRAIVASSYESRHLARIDLAGRSPLMIHGISSSSPEGLPVGKRALPLLGRSEERRFLADRWRSARNGTFQAVQICGEPGIGKSKLVADFYDSASSSEVCSLILNGSEHSTGSPFYSVTEMLRQLFGLAVEDELEADERADRVAATLAGMDLSNSVLDALAPLLSLSDDALTRTSGTPDPERMRQRTLEALSSVVWACAELRPTVMIVEDLHWIDPSTLELLENLIRHQASVGLLILLTFRPEFSPPWGHRPDVAQLSLEPLDDEQARCLIRRMTRDRELPAEWVEHIVERTDGVPLYVEQLTEMLVEQDESAVETLDRPPASATPVAIPAALQTVLTARLDRLGSAKSIAQLASVLGRDFSFEMLESVSSKKGDSLRRELDRLVDAGFIRRRARDLSSYRFKHALIQDAVSRSLLKRNRRQMHRRIADNLCASMPDWASRHPELLARHEAEGGRWLAAARLWRSAGDRALERFANVEAVGHYRAALECLARTPESLARNRRELELQVCHAQALISIRGFTAPEVEAIHSRALELMEAVPVDTQVDTRFKLLWGLWAFRNNRGRLQSASEIARRMLAIAPSDEAECLAREAFGISAHFLGDLAVSIEHFEAAQAIFARKGIPDAHHLGFAGSFDNRVGILGGLSFFRWLSGLPDQGLALADETVELGKQLRPKDLARALLSSVWVAFECGDYESSFAYASRAHGLCRDHQLFFLPQTSFFLGLTEEYLGLSPSGSDGVRGLDRTELAYRQLHADGSHKIGASRRLSYWAAAHLRLGQTESVERLLTRGFRLMEETGERFFESELLRLQAELILAGDGEPSDAERLLRQSIEVADSQTARSLTLRSAITLSRLLADTGRAEDGAMTLTAVYGRFTEGFETADLRRAAELLKALRRLH